MHYWLMKSEPGVFSITDLKNSPRKTSHWDGVRNYQARNMLRDTMKIGDQIFFYHSNCPQPGIVGIMEVIREGYPDFTAFDPANSHYDPRSGPDEPRWYMVDVRYVRTLKRPVTLQELRTHRQLADMPLIRRGNRLSVMPVTKRQWDFVLGLE